MGAYVYRIRLEANGSSAAEVETAFGVATKAIEDGFAGPVYGYDTPFTSQPAPVLMSVVDQHIEIDKAEPDGMTRFTGRRILAANIVPFLNALLEPGDGA